MRTDNNVRLPDGRNLSYAEFGKPDGYPVLYFHGTPSSRLEPLLFAEDEVIARLGLRMIAAGRPSMIASWMFKLWDKPNACALQTKRMGSDFWPTLHPTKVSVHNGTFI